MSTLPGPSIPLDRAGLCLDCLVVFDMSDGQCPKCASTSGIASVRVSGKNIPENETADVASTSAGQKRG